MYVGYLLFNSQKSVFKPGVSWCRTQTLNKGLVIRNRTPYSSDHRKMRSGTNQIRDINNTLPVITNFARIDNTTPKMEMDVNVY